MKEIADRGVEELSENGNAKEKFGDWRETNATLDNNKVSVNYWSQFCSSTMTFFGEMSHLKAWVSKLNKPNLGRIH